MPLKYDAVKSRVFHCSAHRAEETHNIRKSRFTEHQIMAILKGSEAGVAAAEICRQQGINQAMFYK